jgi:hypothetical protein
MAFRFWPSVASVHRLHLTSRSEPSPGDLGCLYFPAKKTQRRPFQTDEVFVDIFHMFWAQLAGLAIGTLRVTPKARPQ